MRHQRLCIVAILPIIIVIGIACKFYRGPGAYFVNHFGPASVAYEVLLMLLVYLLVPVRKAIPWIAILVFLITCGIEFLQLWHPPWLEWLRGTALGRYVLGTSFSWWDFPAYAAGCLLGAWLLSTIQARCIVAFAASVASGQSEAYAASHRERPPHDACGHPDD